MTKKVILVGGARPNFMKIAPTLRALDHAGEFETVLVHTGQHYDDNMSGAFFSSLSIREPDYFLGVGSGSHAAQTAAIMIEFEKVCLKEKPAVVVVVGDVNSTVAAGLVSKKLQITLAHIEAGLRSRDRSMPEEINRVATDAISDVFFTTEEQATLNLLAEGHPKEAIHLVGHVMIDNLMHQLQMVEAGQVSQEAQWIKARLPEKYICLTMHRPTNVDSKESLVRLLGTLKVLAHQAPIVFPCHPRTQRRIEEFALSSLFDTISPARNDQLRQGIYLTKPMSYNDFLLLWKDAKVVITDSGGLQEETTALKVPCMTIRQNTERPVTITIGSNVVVGTDPKKILTVARQALEGNWKQSGIPRFWDGKAAERIVSVLATSL